MEKTIALLADMANDLAIQLDTSSASLEISLNPTTGQQSPHSYLKIFSRDTAEDLTKKLIEHGFTIYSDYDIGSTEKWRRMKLGPVFVVIKYSAQKTKEERCAELRKELEELGCEDVCGKGDFVPSGDVD